MRARKCRMSHVKINVLRFVRFICVFGLFVYLYLSLGFLSNYKMQAQKRSSTDLLPEPEPNEQRRLTRLKRIQSAVKEQVRPHRPHGLQISANQFCALSAPGLGNNCENLHSDASLDVHRHIDDTAGRAGSRPPDCRLAAHGQRYMKRAQSHPEPSRAAASLTICAHFADISLGNQHPAYARFKYMLEGQFLDEPGESANSLTVSVQLQLPDGSKEVTETKRP